MNSEMLFPHPRRNIHTIVATEKGPLWSSVPVRYRVSHKSNSNLNRWERISARPEGLPVLHEESRGEGAALLTEKQGWEE